MSGVGVGVTVGRAAFTKKETVASILIVGAGLGVGAGVAVGTSVGVGTGACVAQASPMMPEVSSINTKDRSCMCPMGGFIAPFYQSRVITQFYDRAIPEVPLDHKEYWRSGDQSLQPRFLNLRHKTLTVLAPTR